jgi:hypothetical protein
MHWCVLIHQIPPRPLYLRAKVRQRLTRIGAISLKNSVYVLPRTDEAIEDFQWIAEEITAGGGQAYICAGDFLTGVTDRELVEQFNADRRLDYEGLRENLGDPSALERNRARLQEIRAIDFFHAPEGKEVQKMMRALESRVKSKINKHPAVAGKTWVTRRGLKVDRMASAWLIRRFIDPRARFHFVDVENWKRRPGEIAFDMVGGDYTHEGDRCTFETLIAAFRPKASGLRQIAQIVHDIDLKDKKYGRADAAGVQQLIEGIVAGHPGDEERLERGLALFDDLHRSFSRSAR